MLINFSNHPTEKWGSEQKEAAFDQFGEIEYFPFPVIDPHWNYEEVQTLASTKLKAILEEYGSNIHILIAGEQSFLLAFVEQCKTKDISCLVATSNRIVKPLANNKKEIVFEFVKFRKIEL